MARLEGAAGFCAALFVGAVLWALLHFGATGAPALYLFFLALAAIALLTGALLAPERSPRLAGAVFSVVGALLLAYIAFGPSLEGRGYVFYGIGWLSFYLGARFAASGPGTVRLLVAGLLLLGAFEAGYGLYQSLAGHDFIGSYSRELGRIATGTLINRNHFAAFLNLVLPLGLSMFLVGSSRRRSPRAGSERLALLWLGLTGAALMALAVLLSLSRGGTLVLLGVVAYLAGVFFLRERLRSGSRVPRTALWVLVVLVLALGLGIGLESLAGRFARLEGEVTRLTIYRDTIELIGDHPLSGIGPGMYRWRFRPYQTAQPEGWYEYAHNDYLESAAEWGVPIAVLLWLGAWWLWWRGARASLRATSAGAAALMLGISASTLSVLVHSSADFVLRTPANWAVAAALFGAGWRLSGPAERGRLASRRAVVVLRLALAVLIVVAGWRVFQRYRAAALSESAASVEELDRALAWDPASPEALFKRGRLERDTLGQTAAARSTLERVVELNPYYWTYRLELARTYELLGEDGLAERSYDQALELNPQGSAFYWNLANFRLRSGRLEDALEPVGRAVGLDAELNGVGYRLLRRAGASTEQVAAHWPPNRKTRLGMLRLAIADGSATAGLIDGEWSRLLEGRPLIEIEDTGFLFRHLRDMGLDATARSYWLELQGLHGVTDPQFQSGANLVWNGSFETALSRHPMDWRIAESEHFAVGRVAREDGPGMALRVDFSGTENLEFSGVLQRLLVRPGAALEISCAMRSEALSSDRGVSLRIVSADGEELWATPPFLSTRPWYTLEGSFRNDGEGSWMTVMLHRGRSGRLDGRLAGTVWLDELVVRAVDEREVLTE